MFKAVEKDLIKTHNKKIESDLNFDITIYSLSKITLDISSSLSTL